MTSLNNPATDTSVASLSSTNPRRPLNTMLSRNDPTIDVSPSSQDYSKPATRPDLLHTTITPRDGSKPPRDVTRAGGSHTTKSMYRAYACRQQGLTVASIMCSSNTSSASTNSQWHASSRQEAGGSQWHAQNKRKICEQWQGSLFKPILKESVRGRELDTELRCR